MVFKTRPYGRPVLVAIVAVALACAGSVAAPDEGADDSGADDPSPTVGSVRVQPDSAVLDPGQQQQFIAEGLDDEGDAVAVEVTWSATGGSISNDGSFTAGESAGSHSVVARDTSGVEDTARVRIRDGGGDDDGGNDGGGDAPSAAECADPDPAWIWCDDFESDRTGAYFEYDDDEGDFVRTSGVGLEGSTAMRARFQAGEVSAGNLKLAFGRTPGTYFEPADEGTADHRELYWRVWVRNEPGWTGGGGAKFSRATTFHADDWSQAMIAHVWSGGPSDHHLVIDPASGTDEAGNVQTSGYNDFDDLRWLGAERGDTPIFDGRNVGEWHCVEARVRLNEPGAADGVFELWVDGSLDARADGLNWVGAYDDYGINALFLENYWNGGSPQAQERYFDQLVVSTERIGC